MALFRTDKHDYTTADDRVWQHPGCVVDLGCDPWDWSTCFIGRKRLIGADPFASQLEGTELFKGVIGATHGTATISCAGDASSIIQPSGRLKIVDMITWKEFKELFKIDQIALLKVNVEGSEYALISSLTDDYLAAINQIAISFHHWVWPAFTKLTQESLERLTNAGFKMQQTNEPWCW